MGSYGFALEEVSSDILRVILPKSGVPLPHGVPTCVYVVMGSRPTVVNTGHPHCRAALHQALDSIGVALDDIDQVVSTARLPDLAAPVTWADAQHFVPGDGTLDSRPPSELYRVELERILQQIEELLQDDRFATTGQADSARALSEIQLYYDPVVRVDSTVTILRDGDQIQLGSEIFSVIQAAGPTPANIALLGSSSGVMFCGDLLQFEPLFMEDPLSLDDTIRRIEDLEPCLLLPSHGFVESDCKRALHQELLRLTMVLSNLPLMLARPMTIPELLVRDLGFFPKDIVRFLGSCRRMCAFAEALVGQGALVARGEGVWREFAIGFPDTVQAPSAFERRIEQVLSSSIDPGTNRR